MTKLLCFPWLYHLHEIGKLFYYQVDTVKNPLVNTLIISNNTVCVYVLHCIYVQYINYDNLYRQTHASTKCPNYGQHNINLCGIILKIDFHYSGDIKRLLHAPNI